MISKIKHLIRHRLNTDYHVKELLMGSSIAFFMKIAGSVLGYLVILLITRKYGTDAMGFYALSTTLLSIASILGRLGFDTALIRFVAEYSAQGKLRQVKEIYRKALMVVVPLSLFLSVCLYLLSPVIANFVFDNNSLTFHLQVVSAAILPSVLIHINSQLLRAIKNIGGYSFLQNISNPLFTSVFLLILLYAANQSYYPVVAFCLSVLFGSILSHIMWSKALPLQDVPLSSSISYREMLRVSLPMLLSGSMLYLMHWTDILMLGALRTESEVGVYNVVLKISSVTSITLMAINSIAAPKFAEFYGKGDIDGLGLTVKQTTKMIFWSSVPILTIIMLVPSFILGIFGDGIRRGAAALMILTAGQFINAISGSVGFILQMAGRQNVLQNAVLVVTAMNIILNAILIPRFGINGSAMASAVSMVVLNISCVFAVRIIFKFNTMYVPLISR